MLGTGAAIALAVPPPPPRRSTCRPCSAPSRLDRLGLVPRRRQGPPRSTPRRWPASSPRAWTPPAASGTSSLSDAASGRGLSRRAPSAPGGHPGLGLRRPARRASRAAAPPARSSAPRSLIDFVDAVKPGAVKTSVVRIARVSQGMYTALEQAGFDISQRRPQGLPRHLRPLGREARPVQGVRHRLQGPGRRPGRPRTPRRATAEAARARSGVARRRALGPQHLPLPGRLPGRAWPRSSPSTRTSSGR